MNLSPDQKKWCNLISSGDIFDPFSFLKKECILSETYTISKDGITMLIPRKQIITFSNGKVYKEHHYIDCVNNYRFTYNDDYSERIKSFISLIVFLKENHLILLYDAKDDYTLGYREYSDNNHNNEKLNNFLHLFNHAFLVDKLHTKELITNSSLETFIKNGFKSDKELEIEAQQNAYKDQIEKSQIQLRISRASFKAQKKAIEEQVKFAQKSLKMARYTLIATLIIAIGTAVFNYCTYTKERKVEIINLDSALVKVSRSPLYRGSPLDSLSRAPSPRDTSLARAGKERGK